VAYCTHRVIQGASASTSVKHSVNATKAETEQETDNATIEALSNLATSTAADHSYIGGKLLLGQAIGGQLI
jgi:hypothetical protein